MSAFRRCVPLRNEKRERLTQAEGIGNKASCVTQDARARALTETLGDLGAAHLLISDICSDK